MKSTVSVVKGTDVDRSVRKAIDLIGGIRSVIQTGQTVLIKPNFAVVAPPGNRYRNGSGYGRCYHQDLPGGESGKSNRGRKRDRRIRHRRSV